MAQVIIDVIGYKCFKGTIDGKINDSGTLYALVRMDETYNRTDESGTNWKGGHAIESWRLPNAEMVMRMAHLKPSIKNPVAVKLETERVSNGTETREIVVDAVPVTGSVIDQKTGEVKEPAAMNQPMKKAA